MRPLSPDTMDGAMTGMPYIMDKGLLFSFLDSRYSDPSERRALWYLLGQDVSFAEISTSAPGGNAGVTAQLDAGSPPGRQTNDARLDHLMRHWFGKKWNGDRWVDDGEATTGKWTEWKGDAEAIFRSTLRRAIEVSFGVEHDPDALTLGDERRDWPVQFLWICGSPRFEGWVVWRGWDHEDVSQPRVDDAGLVTVIFSTPGGQSPLSLRLTIDDDEHMDPADRLIFGGPDYELNPTDSLSSNGMWVIGHEVSTIEPMCAPPSASNDQYEWGIPADAPPHRIVGCDSPTHACAPPVVVRPSEFDGGVLKGGRTWL